MQCATMNRRTLTMNWDGLGDEDEDDRFFEPSERASSAIPLDLCSSGSDEETDFEDSRMSFVSTVSSVSFKASKSSSLTDYDMWMSEPGDIRERRKRLLGSMGLSSTKDMLKNASMKLAGAVSRKHVHSHDPGSSPVVVARVDPPAESKAAPERVKPHSSPEKVSRSNDPSSTSPSPHSNSHSQPPTIILVRSRSDSDIEALSAVKQLMRRKNVVDAQDSKKFNHNSYFTKSFRNSKRKGAAFLKNIKGVTSSKSLTSKEQEQSPPEDQQKGSDRQVVDWTDVHEMVTAACYTPDGQVAILYLHHLNTGFRNTSSQIFASFSPDGKHVISASEDSQVYIWKVAESKNPGGGKKRSKITVHDHEHFQCKDVTVAIAWPGSIKNEPPIVEIHSKRHSKRLTAPSPNSPHPEDNAASRRYLPPLPKKNTGLERIDSTGDDDFGSSAKIDPGIGITDSFRSSSGSISYRDSPSISGSSPSHSWSSSDIGGSRGGQTVQATAWGMVIVTASLEGEIRVYQNFGLPHFFVNSTEISFALASIKFSPPTTHLLPY